MIKLSEETANLQRRIRAYRVGGYGWEDVAVKFDLPAAVARAIVLDGRGIEIGVSVVQGKRGRA